MSCPTSNIPPDMSVGEKCVCSQLSLEENYIYVYINTACFLHNLYTRIPLPHTKARAIELPSFSWEFYQELYPILETMTAAPGSWLWTSTRACSLYWDVGCNRHQGSLESRFHFEPNITKLLVS